MVGVIIPVYIKPLDADLTSIAGLAGTSGLLKKTAANTWSLDTNTYLTGNQLCYCTGVRNSTYGAGAHYFRYAPQ